jgi:hypothetical protein
MDTENETSVHYPTEHKGCGGIDCSWFKLKPFTTQTLVSIVPAPPAANQARVTFDAKVAMQQQLADLWAVLGAFAAGGDLFATIVRKLMHGYGGQEICDLNGSNCECALDKTAPEIWTAPPFTSSVTVTVGGVAYTANFSFTPEFDIVHGHCAKKFY